MTLFQKNAEKKFNECPRNLFVQTLEQLEKNWDAKVLLSFEIGFIFLNKSNNVVELLDQLNNYFRIARLHAEMLDLIEEIIEIFKQNF